MNSIISTVKSNPVGLIVGAGAGFLIAKKVVKTDKVIVLVAVTAVTAILGAMAQSKMHAKKSEPTAATVKK